MAHAYDARPPYPGALIEAIAGLGERVLDLGAGIGHLALPLAALGRRVTAVEPARAMLARLQQRAEEQALVLEAVHAQAESLPLATGSFNLVLIADALHFLDAERTGHEVARVLASAGALAIVTVELADTPYMNALTALMREAAPRKPRQTTGTLAQLAALVGVSLRQQEFTDEHALSSSELERLLATISFVGPAMNVERTQRFLQRVAALGPPSWARRFVLHVGRR